MSRTPDHESGARVQINLRLPPAHADRLKEVAAAKNRSQSDIVAKMIERSQWNEGEATWDVSEIIPPLAMKTLSRGPSCQHIPVPAGSSGLTKCRECGEVQGVDGVWRSTRLSGAHAEDCKCERCVK